MAFAAPVSLGSSSADGSATTIAVTLTGGANIGDLVVVGVRSQTGTVASISDPHGNTWQIDNNFAQGSTFATLCSSRLTVALAVSDIVTVTFDVAATARRAKVWQCTGVVAAGTYTDNQNSNHSGSATSLSSGPVTPATSNCLLMACFGYGAGSAWNGGESAGWTDLNTLGGDRSRAQYKIVSGAPTETATGLLTVAALYTGVIQAYASAVVIGTPFRNIHQKNQAVSRASRW